MAQFPHISRSGDGSLRHRIDEYMEAVEAFGRLEESLNRASNSKERDWIGDAKELAEAEKILKSSLAHVTAAIDAKELRQAVEQGLLSEEQAKQFSRTKTQMDFEQQAKKSAQSQADKSGQSQ